MSKSRLQHKWTDHNSIPPTSNLTIHKDVFGDSYAEFSGTVYANTGYSRIATIAPFFKKVNLSKYATPHNPYTSFSGAIVVEARYGSFDIISSFRTVSHAFSSLFQPCTTSPAPCGVLCWVAVRLEC